MTYVTVVKQLEPMYCLSVRNGSNAFLGQVCSRVCPFLAQTTPLVFGIGVSTIRCVIVPFGERANVRYKSAHCPFVTREVRIYSTILLLALFY